MVCKMFHHGDVILKSVETIPEGFKSIKIANGFVIEKGEGIHTHRIATLDLSELADKCEVYTNAKGEMCVKVKEPIKIEHEEHGTRVIEPGIFIKDIERQYSYEDNEERKVLD